MIVAGESLHGAIQQSQHPARIHLGVCAAQQLVAPTTTLDFAPTAPGFAATGSAAASAPARRSRTTTQLRRKIA